MIKTKILASTILAGVLFAGCGSKIPSCDDNEVLEKLKPKVSQFAGDNYVTRLLGEDDSSETRFIFELNTDRIITTKEDEHIRACTIETSVIRKKTGTERGRDIHYSIAATEKGDIVVNLGK